jgi:F420-non-reducing hydrogenase iron-sulfur subunit
MSKVVFETEEDKEIKEDKDWKPRILAFLCNWCSYAGADLAGVSRIQYPATVRIVRVPCTGRINPFFIIKALTDGWDGIVVSGCHPGDCHYISGNLVARRRFAMLNKLLEFFGIEPGRINFMWASAAEGERFANLIAKATENVKKLGPNKKFLKKW